MLTARNGHYLNKLLIFSTLLMGLQGCGGGGDDKQSASSVSSSLRSSTSSSRSSLGTSSSTASSQSSSVAAITTSLSGVVSVQDASGEFIEIFDTDEVEILISLVNDQQETVASTTAELMDIDTSNQLSLPFSAELGADDARYVVVNIRKSGYTDYARRFSVEDSININATLSEVPTEEIQPTSAQTISGEAVTGFNFSVVTTDDGQQVQEGTGDSIPELSVSIPESVLPEGTEFIDVKMQAFNPNDVEDAAYFPGAYEDSTGNKLLSVAFNYTDVTTSGGVSLQKVAMDTRNKRLAAEKRGISFQKFAEESEPVIINRTIPAESCLSLSQLGDSNVEMSGFQVPVYTYNPVSGVWDLLGHGTLYGSDGELIDSTFNDFDCEENVYVLEIKVTNEIFLSNWWNLDYPLVFEEPVKLCATVALKNEQGLPAIGSILFVNDDDDARSFSAETFVTDENGMAQIEVYSLGDELDTSANLTIYTQDYSQRIQKSFQLSTNCVNPTPIEIPVELPALCKVSGKLTSDVGAPLADAFVFALASDENSEDEYAMPAYGQTNANGQYAFNVNCGFDYKLFEYFSWLMSLYSLEDDNELMKNFNVNEQVTADEKSDSGEAVVMKDLTINHNKPFAYVYNDEEGGSTLQVTFWYGGENYPLHYEFDVVDSETETIVGRLSGEITAEDVETESDESGWMFDAGVVNIEHDLPVPDAFAVYSIRGTITDAEDNEGKVSGYVFLEPAE